MFWLPDLTITSFFRKGSPTHGNYDAIDIAPTNFSQMKFDNLAEQLDFYFSVYLELYSRLEFGALIVNKGPDCLHYHVDLRGGAGAAKSAGWEITDYVNGRCVNRGFYPASLSETRRQIYGWLSSGFYGVRVSDPGSNGLFDPSAVVGTLDFVKYRIPAHDIATAEDLLALAFPSRYTAIALGATALGFVFLLSRI